MPDRNHEKRDFPVWIYDAMPQTHDDPLHTWYAVALAIVVVIGLVLLWRYGA